MKMYQVATVDIIENGTSFLEGHRSHQVVIKGRTYTIYKESTGRHPRDRWYFTGEDGDLYFFDEHQHWFGYQAGIKYFFG
jgi:hypothetical protein